MRMVKEMRTRGVTRPPVRDGQREGFLCNLYAKLTFTLTNVPTTITFPEFSHISGLIY